MNCKAAILPVVTAFFALAAGAQPLPEESGGDRTRGTVVDFPESDRLPESDRPDEVTLPPRGLTKTRVLLRFGEPDRRHEPVGTPPITRWDYGDFSVFFERDLVLHSVVPGQLPPLQHRDELAGG